MIVLDAVGIDIKEQLAQMKRTAVYIAALQLVLLLVVDQ